MNDDGLSEGELVQRAYGVTGGKVADLSLVQLKQLMTVTQFVTDLCLNEAERRGALEFDDDAPVVPYVSGYMVETVLTRSLGPARQSRHGEGKAMGDIDFGTRLPSDECALRSANKMTESYGA